ncbi:hypothetical protein E2C01_022485 [Portunus trituberculatus]|uniref:Uncharacterized protein n=1 Tax=Portunus trituberculatus TaxID=210409 RepID=A0A5B7E5G6_PORTR|nr:hypothetical protein [Portunus trituberculatus]
MYDYLVSPIVLDSSEGISSLTKSCPEALVKTLHLSILQQGLGHLITLVTQPADIHQTFLGLTLFLPVSVDGTSDIADEDFWTTRGAVTVVTTCDTFSIKDPILS